MLTSVRCREDPVGIAEFSPDGLWHRHAEAKWTCRGSLEVIRHELEA